MSDDQDQNQQEEPVYDDRGEAYFAWSIPEYKKYQRSISWYVIAIVVMIALITYSIYTANLLFGLIIILASLTYFYHDRNEPIKLQFAVTDKGFMIGSHFHSFRDVTNFYIIYRPPQVTNLFVEFSSLTKPRLSIPLTEQNPVELRNFLKQFLFEDLEKEDEPLSETLGNLLKM